MHPDMMILAERLVIAMEAMSQDLKNMSAYLYDISCSVSHLRNEGREKEVTSVVACDEGDYPSSATSGQYEEADERPSSYMQPEHGDDSFGDIATRSIDSCENFDDFSSKRNSDFTGAIKIEELSEVEENDGSSDVDDMYGDSRNNVQLSKVVECETQLETERGDQAYGLLPTTSHSMGQLTTSESTARREFASDIKPQEIQCVETSSNSAINSELTTFVLRLPEEQTTVAGSSLMESAEHTLMGHRRVPSGERPYQCSVCEKSFKIRSRLERHKKVHTGEKPYKCNVCGKAFAENGNVTLHMRSHTGERPYICNVCGKSFKQSTNLTVHMRSHTGEKPFECTICGKAFFRNITLRNHMRTHTGEKPYRCSVCGKSFGRCDSLSQHMRKHSTDHHN